MPLTTVPSSFHLLFFFSKIFCVKKFVERNPQSVTQQLNGNDAGISTASMYNIFQCRGRHAAGTRKLVQIIPVLRAQLLYTHSDQFSCVHTASLSAHIWSITSIGEREYSERPYMVFSFCEMGDIISPTRKGASL